MAQGGKHWQKRWFVFDLQKGSLAWYQDNRELRIHLKGSLTIPEMQRVQQPKPAAGDPSEANSFHILTLKRPYHVRGFSDASTLAWMNILSAVAAKSDK